MKNIIAISLAIVLLLQGMFSFAHAEQLAKIPSLMAHFFEHHTDAHEAGEAHLSMFDFLEQHYGSNQHHEDSDHEQMPGHCHHCCCVGAVFVAPSAVKPLSITALEADLDSKIAASQEDLPASPCLDDIFRPPLA